MRPLSFLLPVFAGTLLASASSWLLAQSSPGGARIAPDMVLVHGKIITVDATDAVVEALAIRNGKILALGSDKTMLALAGPHTTVLDLHGRTATPGLIDTHAHLLEGGLDELFRLNLSDGGSVAEIVRRVKARALTLKPGEWLQGSGWDEGKLAEGRMPNAADLDEAAPRNPVWLTHTTGHYGVANTAALKLAHITAETKAPSASTIDHDAEGKPTGVLREDPAMGLILALVPPPTPEQRRAAVEHEIQVLHSEGMTAIKDPSINPSDWDAYKSLLGAGKLDAHICVLWYAGATMATAEKALAEVNSVPRAPQSLGDGRLISCGVKIFMDGSGGGRTAWLYDDWNLKWTGVDTGNRGYPATDPETYRQMVRLFQHARVPIGTHAIGDRAIDWVIDTYTQALKEDPASGLRHSIIHANIPTDHALNLMARLQQQYDAGYPEAQAPFLWWLGDVYAGNFGPVRSPRLMPFKTFLKQQIVWGGGSDFPVAPLAARYGLWSSVERKTLKSLYGPQPFGAVESIDIHVALRSYTRWAARQLFLEDHIGSLETGKAADIAVWDRDLYTTTGPELKDLKCELTLFDGRVVYREKGMAKDREESPVPKSKQKTGRGEDAIVQ